MRTKDEPAGGRAAASWAKRASARAAPAAASARPSASRVGERRGIMLWAPVSAQARIQVQAFQLLAVGLVRAGGGEGAAGQQLRRDHVGRQATAQGVLPGRQRFGQRLQAGGSRRCRLDEADQPDDGAVRPAQRHRGAGAHAGQRRDRGVDLGQFDAIAVQLDLVVDAATERDQALAVDLAQVAAAVAALAAAREHARGVQVRPVQVAAHDMVAGDADLALVDEDVGIRLGAADGEGIRRGLAQRGVDLDPGGRAGGFGRTVGIDDARIGEALPQFSASAGESDSAPKTKTRRPGRLAPLKSGLNSCCRTKDGVDAQTAMPVSASTA